MYHVHAALLWSPELLTHQQPSSITFKLIDISSHNPKFEKRKRKIGAQYSGLQKCLNKLNRTIRADTKKYISVIWNGI